MRVSKRTEERDRELLSLWRERSVEQRHEIDVIPFHAYIEKNYPRLFKGISGDPYQYLMGLLRRHCTGTP